MSQNKKPDNTSDLYAVRLEKLANLKADGKNPFIENWDQSHTSTSAKALFDNEKEEGPEVSVAGRIMALRIMGKASFIKIF